MSGSDMDKTVLLTGIAGGLARLAGAQLVARGYRVVGVDYRPLEQDLPFEAVVYRANYNKTKIEDIFRRHRPWAVLHLGRVGNLKMRTGKRFDLNVIGSSKMMDLSIKYAVRRFIVLSTFHIYGAHPHNHTPIFEDEPLRAGTGFPQIGDAIQLDNQAVMWIWRYPEVRTAVLRPCNVIGPDIQNAMSRLLRQSVKPVMLGFNPMVQFIHQDDLVRALLACLLSDGVGVFNLAGRSCIPWREALEISGGYVVSVPATIASLGLSLLRKVTPVLPSYMVNFTKYPCLISDEAFRRAFNWAPTVDTMEAILSTVR